MQLIAKSPTYEINAQDHGIVVNLRTLTKSPTKIYVKGHDQEVNGQ